MHASTAPRHTVRRSALLVALALTSGLTGFADDPSATWDADNYCYADRAFVVPYPRQVPRGRLMFGVDHRTYQPLDEDPGSSLLGFDAGNLTIGLGLRYGLLDAVDVGLRRYNATTTDYDTYALDSRWRWLDEKDAFADVAIGGGVAWFDGERADDEYGGMAQVLVGRTVLPRLYMTTGVRYHSRPEAMTPEADVPHYSVAVLASGNLLLRERLALVTEWSIPVDGAWEGAPAWAAGPKYYTRGHTFSIVFSNAHSISDDRLTAGSRQWDHVIMGFTITRLL